MKHEISRQPELSLQTVSKEMAEIRGELDKIRRVISEHGQKLGEVENEYPLLPAEADDLASAVKKVGKDALGGKDSAAYKNRELRASVYRDIYTEVKRQYGLIDEYGHQKSYKKLKRKFLPGALLIVEEYKLPIALENLITAENEAGELMEDED